MATDILPRDLGISLVVDVLVPSLQADTWTVAALSDQAAADVYNDPSLVARTRDTLTGREILGSIDPAEYAAIPANRPYEHATVMGIVGVADEIDVGPGTFARAALLNIFGAGSNTIASLAALLNVTVSPAESLDLPPLTARDIAAARDWIARNP